MKDELIVFIGMMVGLFAVLLLAIVASDAIKSHEKIELAKLSCQQYGSNR